MLGAAAASSLTASAMKLILEVEGKRSPKPLNHSPKPRAFGPATSAASPVGGATAVGRRGSTEDQAEAIARAVLRARSHIQAEVSSIESSCSSAKRELLLAEGRDETEHQANMSGRYEFDGGGGGGGGDDDDDDDDDHDQEEEEERRIDALNRVEMLSRTLALIIGQQHPSPPTCPPPHA